MTLTLNLSVAVDVSPLAREILDASDPENIIYGDQLPGVRLDVQREVLDLYPELQAYAITPTIPIHDCGPNGVRLFFGSWDTVHDLAPPSNSPWTLFYEVEEL